MANFRSRLFLARELADLTQEGLGAACGIAQPRLSDIEHGRRDATREEQARLAAALKLSVRFLFDADGRTSRLGNSR